MQKFILETNKDIFLNAVDISLKEGFQLIPGSNYIKSLPENIDVTSGQVLGDIDHVFSVAIRDTLDSMVFSGNLVLFRTTVNEQLAKNNMIIGSLYIEAILKNGFEKCKRVYTTYYSCCLYKE